MTNFKEYSPHHNCCLLATTILWWLLVEFYGGKIYILKTILNPWRDWRTAEIRPEWTISMKATRDFEIDGYQNFYFRMNNFFQTVDLLQLGKYINSFAALIWWHYSKNELWYLFDENSVIGETSQNNRWWGEYSLKVILIFIPCSFLKQFSHK